MIRKIIAADFEFIYHLYMHPSINPYLLYEQMSKDEFKPVYNSLLEKNIIYIFSADGEDRGMFKFIHQEYRNSHTAYLGGVAINPLYTGKGYGLQMMQAIITLAKQTNLTRIELTVATFNNTAISLYEKVGFVKEGVLRNYTWLKSEGRYIDEQMMSCLL